MLITYPQAPAARIVPDSGNHSWRPLFPFTSRWQSIAGQQLHYVDEGPTSAAHGETLLFVHGNPTWSFHWRNLIGSLRDRYRCVAVDHLGCGLSEKRLGRPFRLDDRIDHLVEFLDRLELDGVSLVAQDWGGAIGLAAALGRSDRFRRIALFNTGAFPPRSIPWRIRACRIPILGRLAVQGAGLFSRAALRMTLSRRVKLDPRAATGYLAPYPDWSSRKAIFDFVADIPASPRHPTWQTLTDIEAGLPELGRLPILLCWGMRDWCFTPQCLERFASHWPHAQRCEIPDAGHWVVEDAPQQVRQTLTRFLEGVPIDSYPKAMAAIADDDAPQTVR